MNCDSNSRLVVDEDDTGKFRLGKVNGAIEYMGYVLLNIPCRKYRHAFIKQAAVRAYFSNEHLLGFVCTPVYLAEYFENNWFFWDTQVAQRWRRTNPFLSNWQIRSSQEATRTRTASVTVPAALETVPAVLATVPAALATVPAALATVPAALATVPATSATVPAAALPPQTTTATQTATVLVPCHSRRPPRHPRTLSSLQSHPITVSVSDVDNLFNVPRILHCSAKP